VVRRTRTPGLRCLPLTSLGEAEAHGAAVVVEAAVLHDQRQRDVVVGHGAAVGDRRVAVVVRGAGRGQQGHMLGPGEGRPADRRGAARLAQREDESPVFAGAISPDGQLAYVTGGHSFGNAGWDGVSVVDLQRRSVTELAVPERPLDIQIFPERG